MTNSNNPNNMSVYKYISQVSGYQGNTIYGYILKDGGTVEVNADNVNRAAGVNPSYAPGYPAYPAMPTKTLRSEFDQVWYANTVGFQALDTGIASGIASDAFDYAMKHLPYGTGLNSNFNNAYYLSNARPEVALYVSSNPLVNGITSQPWPCGTLHYYVYGETEALPANQAQVQAMIANFPSIVQTTFNVLNISKVSPPVYTALTAGNDIGGVYNAGPLGANYTATDSQIQAGDVVNGNTAAASNMGITVANVVTTPQATFSNIGIYNLTYTAAGTVDATNFSNFGTANTTNGTNSGAVNFLNSTAAGIISNLNTNVNIGMMSTGVTSATVGYTAAALTGNTNTVNVNLNTVGTSAIARGQLTLNGAGFFKTAHVNSTGTGASANYLTLVGTALQGTTEIDVNNVTGDGSGNLVLSVDAGITTVRTVKAANTGTTAILFNDATTGSTSNGVNATFSTHGSKIGFAGATYGITNALNFAAGIGNILSLTYTAANALAANITATNLDTVGFNTAATGAVNLAYFGTGLKNVNVDIASAGGTFTNMPTNGSLNLGLSTGAPTANTLTTSQTTPATGLNVNILGTGPSGGITEVLTFNSATSVNINTASAITGSIAFNLTAPSVNSIVVTGGNSAATVDFTATALPASVLSFDASATSSVVTATSQLATSTAGIMRGSLTAGNTLIGYNGNESIYGGANNDTLNGRGGTNTLTGRAVAGASDINTYKFSDPTGVTTIMDFNAGTNASSIDIIDLKATLTTACTGGGAAATFDKGIGTIAIAGAVVAVQQVTFAGATVQLTNAGNTVLIINTQYANATALQAAVRLNHFVTSDGATNWAAATSALPALYVNSTDGFVHVAAIALGTSAATTSTTEIVNDIAILFGVTSLTNFDATDFLYY